LLWPKALTPWYYWTSIYQYCAYDQICLWIQFHSAGASKWRQTIISLLTKPTGWNSDLIIVDTWIVAHWADCREFKECIVVRTFDWFTSQETEIRNEMKMSLKKIKMKLCDKSMAINWTELECRIHYFLLKINVKKTGVYLTKLTARGEYSKPIEVTQSYNKTVQVDIYANLSSKI